MGRFQGWHIFSRMELLSKNIGNRHHLGSFALPCSSLPLSLRKELIHLSGAMIFVITNQGTSPDHLVLVANRVYVGGQTGLYILAYF